MVIRNVYDLTQRWHEFDHVTMAFFTGFDSQRLLSVSKPQKITQNALNEKGKCLCFLYKAGNIWKLPRIQKSNF